MFFCLILTTLYQNFKVNQIIVKIIGSIFKVYLLSNHFISELDNKNKRQKINYTLYNWRIYIMIFV